MLPTMISNHSPILVYNLVEVGGSILTEVCDRDLVKNQDFSVIRSVLPTRLGTLKLSALLMLSPSISVLWKLPAHALWRVAVP
jgi:hypothetical protein